MHILKRILFYILLTIYSQGNAQEQSFGGLQVSFDNIRYTDNRDLSIRLRFENTTDVTTRPRGIAVAAFLEGGYYSRSPKAMLNDKGGNTWMSVGINGLSFGEANNDWLLLNAGGSAPITYTFKGVRPREPQAPFFFDTELKLFNEVGGKMIRVPISLGPIIP